MRRALYLVVPLLCCTAGCHSAFVDAAVQNKSDHTVSLIEVDYPSASFGIQTLDPGAEKHYRFKILGSGPLKITYTDGKGKQQTENGPVLKEGLEGALIIRIEDGRVSWVPKLRVL